MTDVIPYEKVSLLQDAFNSFANRNGTLKTTSIGRVLKHLGENPSKEEVQEMINLVDKDGSGLIIFPQFLNLMARKVNIFKECKISSNIAVSD